MRGWLGGAWLGLCAMYRLWVLVAMGVGAMLGGLGQGDWASVGGVSLAWWACGRPSLGGAFGVGLGVDLGGAAGVARVGRW